MMKTLRILLVLVTLIALSYVSFAQDQVPITNTQKRWQHLDPDRDKVYGISMDRAYEELLKSKKKKTVVVAVIDSGVDTLNMDLQPILWRNKKEKGLDEDGDGYRNDKYGWNFLGEKKGNPAVKPGYEYQRVYLSMRAKCTNEIESDHDDCTTWQLTKDAFQADSIQKIVPQLKFWQQLATEDSAWRVRLGKDVYKAKDLKPFLKTGDKHFLPSFLGSDSSISNVKLMTSIDESRVKLFKRFSQHPVEHRKETIGDDYNNIDDKFYGNHYVSSSDRHGSDVASVIGAIRNNSIGIDGLADAVTLLPIRVVPSGADEYDKDVALAIRYAVDHGAKVINMSFGKAFSAQRMWVEDAIRYAAKNDVLLVAAAGNEATNIDSVDHYPTTQYVTGEFAPNMIKVGASGMTSDELIASFSNYGKEHVDVFAPGLQVYAEFYNKGNWEFSMTNGTSIAAPVVSGLAAVLRSYYPKLSAFQVKQIIEGSVTKIEGVVAKPGTWSRVPMSDLCRSGGIVNAYKAIKMAEEISRKR